MHNRGSSPLQISAAPRAVGNAAASKYINLYYKYNNLFNLKYVLKKLTKGGVNQFNSELN